MDYQYIKPTVNCGDHIEIDGLSRSCVATDWFRSKVEPPVLTRATAVLTTGGFASQSEARDMTKINSRFLGSVPVQKPLMAIKESSSYSLHKWVDNMVHNELVVYASVSANTCATSFYLLREAEELLSNGTAEEVIVIAEERTTFSTLRIFKEHRIPLVCGDGFAIIRLTLKDRHNKAKASITDTKWKYSYNTNPFKPTSNGYALVDTEKHVDNVKLHGTGTDHNTEAEEVLLHSGRKSVEYKSQIGHTQGTSGLLELCMAIDDSNVNGDTLCVASGLGNFYGSCILHKY